MMFVKKEHKIVSYFSGITLKRVCNKFFTVTAETYTKHCNDCFLLHYSSISKNNNKVLKVIGMSKKAHMQIYNKEHIT